MLEINDFHAMISMIFQENSSFLVHQRTRDFDLQIWVSPIVILEEFIRRLEMLETSTLIFSRGSLYSTREEKRFY